MSESTGKTLRLLFPQWQGGNNPPYHFGAQLLAWLAPEPNGPVEEVPVTVPDGTPLTLENGIIGRSALLAQAAAARALIDKHRPDRLVVLGGDCLVDLAPFAYLNERYDGELAVLWIDAHPDLMTPAQFQHAHAMVLGNLLGNGDADFVDAVPLHIKAQNVLYLGLHDPSEWEAAEIQRLGIGTVSPSLLVERGSQPVIEWFKATGARHLAIHFDLDALDPAFFRGLLFAKPETPKGAFDGVAQGQLSMAQVVEVLSDLSANADVVGIGIAEHLPWDALALKTMLTRLPLIGACDS